MKNVFFLSLYCFIASTCALAQEQVTSASGKIMQAGLPLAGASIALQSEAGKMLAKTSADSVGVYVFNNVPAGNVLIQVTAAGFKPASQKATLVAGDNLVPDITLSPATKELGAVVVQAQRRPIEVKADKTVINVDASPVNAGATALEVLEKSPGVAVDQDGNISLAGKRGVNVMIDGKPAQMSGADLANYLRGLPADQLDQVELITQPSSKYDAEGNAGIINLKMKRNKLKGMNGSLGGSYTQGVYSRFNTNGFIGYRSGKWNLYLNMNAARQNAFNQIDLQRHFYTKSYELTSIFYQHSYLKSLGINSNISFDADYLLSEKTTIGLKVKNSMRSLEFDAPTSLKIYDKHHAFTGTTVTDGNTNFDNANLTVNANVKIALDKKGSVLTADADYARFSSDNAQVLNNYFYGADGSEINSPYLLRGTNPSVFDIYSAKADYSLPLAGNMKLEAGVKSSFVTSDNNSEFENKNSGQWEKDARSNYFVYKENINAAYATLNTSFKKWQLQAGLRLENTNAEGDQRTTNKQFKRNYTQLFPTAFASYKMDNNNSFNLNVGRRIRRPDYDALNPFQVLLNPYTFQQGNPLLQPQFSTNAELGYIYKNGLLSVKLSASQTNNIISEVLSQDAATTISYVQPENLARQQDAELQLGTNVNAKKWWMINATVAGSYMHFSGLLSGYDHDVTFYTFNLNLNNQFKFKKGWSAEVGGYYRYKGLFSGNSVIMPLGQLNAAVSKNILKNKATIKISGRDLLHTVKFRIDQNYHELQSSYVNTPDSRTVNIGFTWRFAKNAKNVMQQRNTGASADEQNRTGRN